MTPPKPCHYCLKEVAHYDRSPGTARRGSVPHKCPHGVKCPGGHPLHRWASVSVGMVKCAECRKHVAYAS